MSFFNVVLDGDRDVELKLGQTTPALREKLKSIIGIDIAQLAAKIRAAVPKKTGKLASEVISSVKGAQGSITGTVSFSAEFAKAGALEYGGTGKAFKVAPHPMTLEHVFARRLSSPETVLVEAHTRAIHIAAHCFLRGPLDAMRSQIESDLQGATDKTIDESNSS